MIVLGPAAWEYFYSLVPLPEYVRDAIRGNTNINCPRFSHSEALAGHSSLKLTAL